MLLLLLLSHFSHVQLCATPWTAAHQAPLSTGFSRQEYWSGLPFPSPRDWMRDGLKFWSVCHLYHFLKCQQMNYFLKMNLLMHMFLNGLFRYLKKYFICGGYFKFFLHFSSEEIHT